MSDGDDDGFSGPDPADVPDDFEDDGNEYDGGFEWGPGPQETPMPGVPDDPPYPSQEGVDPAEDSIAVVDADASCHDCAHFDVCAIYKGFQPLLSEWHTEEPPVDAEKLAWHCDRYDPEGDDTDAPTSLSDM